MNLECLETLKTNSIRWYQFKANSRILVVGDETKSISEFLKLKFEVVEIGANIDYTSNKTFDYIIVKDDISRLENLKKSLNEDGTILLLLNNRWGVTYLAGSDGFKTLYGNANKLLNKDEIEEAIIKAGFCDYKFFYPLPNYEYANSIFSDDYLPEATDSKLANNNIYLEDHKLVFNEIILLRGVTQNGDFTKFTNSFLVEINPTSKEKAIFYNNTRKDEYRLITKIYDGKVEKEPYTTISMSHIHHIGENIEDLGKHGFNMLDKLEDDKIISEYVSLPNIYQVLVNKIKANNVEGAILEIEKLFNEIKDIFADTRVYELNKGYFEGLDAEKFYIVKRAYIDLVFENMFLDGEDIKIYDQEWSIENCPLEFVLFRMIHNMYLMNGEIENIVTREELLKRFGIWDCFESFLKAESIFQRKVLNWDIIEIYERVHELLK